MKFSFNFLQIITFIKERPEKVFSGLLLAIFIFLSLYLAIGWPKRRAYLPPEEITIERIKGELVTPAAILVDFGDLLTRRPITHYRDLIQRNPFARLPEVMGLPRNDEDERPIIVDRRAGLIIRGIMSTPDGLVAFIEGRETYVAREGDEVEGWKVIKVDREEVKLYNEERGEELILPLGGGPEEEERARKEREERRRRRWGRPIEGPGRRPEERFRQDYYRR